MLRDLLKKKKGLELENESADILANAGYKVEQNPGTKPGTKKNPDYRIEGKYFDCYAPASNNLGKVRNSISEKVSEGQTLRVIVNFSRTDLSVQDVQAVLKRKPISGLEEVIGVTKDSEIINIYP